MKQTILSISILCIAICTLTSCTKDKLPSNPTVTEILQQGKWKITLYTDNGTDDLFRYTDYSFTFGSGTIAAVNKSSTTNGTFTLSNDDDSGVKFILNFGAVIPFDELNEDWQIIEQTTTKIRLQDISGGHGGTSFLTFEKI
ncbi:MAG TPA: hypothetical protein PK431_09335 [Chitinophagales bacterium]|nr:hypothetical protein [Chitinophagales bacterium]